ncbi:2-succinyl-6-hydroxy-2,4-cyclohexadiene-1-carboxylate synthase [Virgibacillus sp. MSP4-1]|uniref:2-succinyl-6-hydroxy-2, 4-cyclohexadiene-1-carboxylate synthase n=1 Tax=Virgibacillus sp. MSP4-1 TaxID=2700081 RepID=UPI0003AB2050|nr:2-succinyl-6-hydroxy-2,4-cyclohexadiene-1-carboxylate synthase [Virgibacillus sp. MSP4-1]QHS23103.1 2-succinyl-6-hydroxy-2,4-cyclohexadiene-1-carboxylate synthase [Virgibacillus sp. MSP4-1]
MYINVDGKKYWVEEEGTGEPLVLFHGFTGSTKTWTPFISQWSRNFQVINLDLPGHGKTIVQEPFSMESVSADLNQILKKLDLRKVHLLGYSMGGRTALSFARLYPESINTLILESASPGLKTQEEQEERQNRDEQLAKKVETEGLDAFVEYWSAIPLFETQKSLPKQVQNQLKQERLSHKPEGLAASLRYMGTGTQPSWWKELHEIYTRTLLLTGDLDKKFTSINKDMQERLSNAQHQIIKDAGHTIHVERPRIFGKIVSDFILHK